MVEDEFRKFAEQASTQHSTKDEQIAELESNLQSEKDARLEDRFMFIFLGFILIDIHIFIYLETWGGPIALLILELLFLVVMARRMGVDDITLWLDKTLASVNSSHGRDNG